MRSIIKSNLAVIVLSVVLSLFVGNAFSQTSDFQWTFNSNGLTSYTLTFVSSTELYDGDLPADDPTINLELYKRYEVTVVNQILHPLLIMAKGDQDSDDVIFLAQRALFDVALTSLEADPDIAWFDDGAGKVWFTLTPGLYKAMRQSGLNPGYRCGNHTIEMRGDFNVKTDSTLQSGLAMELELIATGLVAPISMTNAGDGSGRLFVVDQIGKIHIIENGSLIPTPFLDVGDKLAVLDPGFDERGLLGLAFHPDYETNGRFFVYYNAPPTTDTFNNQSVLAEYSVSEGDPNLADAGSEAVLLTLDDPEFNHDGGQLAFGQDGYLYFSLGDGGGGGDEHGTIGNGQDLSTTFGAILRLDVSTPGAYAIPADNPFVGIEGNDLIWAYGLRNPWKFSFDASGRLICGDVGQGIYEEINIIEKGKNYGWRIMEGFHCFNPEENCDSDGLELPVLEYSHDLGTAIIGGYFYTGSEFPDLVGKYVFGDWSLPGFGGDGRLFYADETPSGEWEFFEFVTNGGPGSGFGTYVLAFGQGEDGEIYVLSSQSVGPDPEGTSGSVHRITKSPKTSVNQWPLYE